MAIIDDSRIVNIKPHIAPLVEHTACGNRIRRHSLVDIAIGVPVERPFIRVTPRTAPSHGTVVLDASGSMGVSDATLQSILDRISFGTVAYYYGDDRRGWLVVYSRDGLRRQSMVPRDCDGNTVDLPAIEWLMRQPKPWHFVSDLGFCGDTKANEALAKHLLAINPIRVHNSIADFNEYLDQQSQ